MADINDDLLNYNVQLQQVENALVCDPNNQELLKLKIDLEEVIKLTEDLRNDQLEQQKSSSGSAAFSQQSAFVTDMFASATADTSAVTGNTTKNKTLIASNTKESHNSGDESVPDEITASLMVLEKLYETQQTGQSQKTWTAGEPCLAKWTNGKYYDAVIDTINENGTVNVTFDTFKNRAVTTLRELKRPDGTSRPLNDVGLKKSNKLKDKELMKKKKLKKQVRLKEMEEEREVDKNKWVSFFSKNVKKKGAVKKSIFAAPETVTGRVGVGTCGISGRPMTDFSTPKTAFRR